jgi:plastocyanin
MAAIRVLRSNRVGGGGDRGSDMLNRWLVPMLCALLAAGPAAAAGLVVRVFDGKGHPVPDAVVTLVPRTASEPVQRRAPVTRVIDQKNLMFLPYIEVFRRGDTVVFRNSDRTRHHVYSFSRAKAFEFVLAPGQSSPPLVLDKAGVVAVGCNIHDQMAAYLVVTDASAVARSRSDGNASFGELAPGTYDVRVWHPRQRPGRATSATVDVSVSAPAPVTITLSLLPDPRQQMDREHMQY